MRVPKYNNEYFIKHVLIYRNKLFLLAVSFTYKLLIKSIYLIKNDVLHYYLSICIDMKMIFPYFLTG